MTPEQRMVGILTACREERCGEAVGMVAEMNEIETLQVIVTMSAWTDRLLTALLGPTAATETLQEFALHSEMR